MLDSHSNSALPEQPTGVVDKNAPSAVQKCQRLQHELLQDRDPALYQCLQEHGIEPQIYALRWVRLLFGREFHLDDVIALWDAIFAAGIDLKLVDYVGLAMLLFIREQLLDRPYEIVLKRLFKVRPPPRATHVPILTPPLL